MSISVCLYISIYYIVMNAKVIPNANCLKLLMWYKFICILWKISATTNCDFCRSFRYRRTANDPLLSFFGCCYFWCVQKPSTLFTFRLSEPSTNPPPPCWFAYTVRMKGAHNGRTNERFIRFRYHSETLTWRFSRFVRLFWSSPRKWYARRDSSPAVRRNDVQLVHALGMWVYCKCINHRLRFSCANERRGATDNVIAVASLYNNTVSGWKTKRIKQLNDGASLGGVSCCFARARHSVSHYYYYY